MKAGIVAKIAAQAAELYAEASRQLGRDMLRSLWERVCDFFILDEFF